MAPPSKRSAHSDVDKQSLRVYARQNPSYKQHELLDWAKSHLNCSSTITQSMVSKWLGPRYEYLDSPTASTARMDGGKMFRPNRVIVDTIRGHRRDNSTARRIAMENRSMNDID